MPVTISNANSGRYRRKPSSHLNTEGLEVMFVLQLSHAAADRQQRLRGYAAPVDASAAHDVTLDNGRLQTLQAKSEDSGKALVEDRFRHAMQFQASLLDLFRRDPAVLCLTLE